MKKPSFIYKNFEIISEIRNETVQNTVKSLNTDDQIFENIIANDNL